MIANSIPELKNLFSTKQFPLFFMYFISAPSLSIYAQVTSKNSFPKPELQFYSEIKPREPELYFAVLNVLLLQFCIMYFKQNSHKYSPAAYPSTGSIFKCNNDNSEHTSTQF